jgi:hypothetical protein
MEISHIFIFWAILNYKLSIHPRDKQTAADRLANSAKKLLYGMDFSSFGPMVFNFNQII